MGGGEASCVMVVERPPRGRKISLGEEAFLAPAKYVQCLCCGVTKKGCTRPETGRSTLRRELALNLVGKPGASQMEVGKGGCFGPAFGSRSLSGQIWPVACFWK